MFVDYCGSINVRVEDSLAPNVAGVRELGGVGIRVVAADQRLALGGGGGGGAQQLGRRQAGVDQRGQVDAAGL